MRAGTTTPLLGVLFLIGFVAVTALALLSGHPLPIMMAVLGALAFFARRRRRGYRLLVVVESGLFLNVSVECAEDCRHVCEP